MVIFLLEMGAEPSDLFEPLLWVLLAKFSRGYVLRGMFQLCQGQERTTAPSEASEAVGSAESCLGGREQERATDRAKAIECFFSDFPEQARMLGYAMQANNWSIFLALLNLQIKLDTSITGRDIGPTHYAVLLNQPLYAAALLAGGADVNKTEPVEGPWPLGLSVVDRNKTLA